MLGYEVIYLPHYNKKNIYKCRILTIPYLVVTKFFIKKIKKCYLNYYLTIFVKIAA